MALVRLKSTAKRNQVLIKDLQKAQTENEDVQRQQDSFLGDLEDARSAQHERLLIIEKLLEFTSLQQQPVDVRQLEDRLNKSIEE